MTNPITEPTQSIRERLARAAHGAFFEGEDWEDNCAEVDREVWREVTDTILSELMEPSEGMFVSVGPMEGFDSYAYENDMDRPHIEWWQAMIQHIRSGGK